MTRTGCAALLLVLIGAGSGLTACSADEPAVCDDVEALSASMDHLKDAQVGENALSVVSTELSKMKSSVAQLAEDAADQFATEIDAVKTQVETLESAVRSATDQPSAAAFTEVSDGFKGVGRAVDQLVETVQGTC